MQIGILYSLHFSFSWFTTWMWSVVDYPLLNPACSRGWFSSSVFSSLFITTFFYPSLKIITILAFFHAVGIRLSGKHLVYSLENVFERVSFPAFNVSMFIWLLPVAVPFFIYYRCAASTSHDVISGTSFGSVWTMATCSLLCSSV